MLIHSISNIANLLQYKWINVKRLQTWKKNMTYQIIVKMALLLSLFHILKNHFILIKEQFQCFSYFFLKSSFDLNNLNSHWWSVPNKSLWMCSSNSGSWRVVNSQIDYFCSNCPLHIIRMIYDIWFLLWKNPSMSTVISACSLEISLFSNISAM